MCTVGEREGQMSAVDKASVRGLVGEGGGGGQSYFQHTAVGVKMVIT